MDWVEEGSDAGELAEGLADDGLGAGLGQDVDKAALGFIRAFVSEGVGGVAG